MRGKVVLVTGASRGLGLAIVEQLLKHNAPIYPIEPVREEIQLPRQLTDSSLCLAGPEQEELQQESSLFGGVNPPLLISPSQQLDSPPAISRPDIPAVRVIATSRTPLSELGPEWKSLLDQYAPHSLAYIPLDLGSAYKDGYDDGNPKPLYGRIASLLQTWADHDDQVDASTPLQPSRQSQTRPKQPSTLRLDAIIHNAGVLDIAKMSNLNLQTLRHVFEVNVFSAVGLIQECLPFMRSLNEQEEHCKCIIVSSGAATKPYDTWSSYCASKASVNSLIACLAKEEPSITSLAIRPGVVDTPMQKLIREHPNSLQSVDRMMFIDKHEQGQLLPPHVPAKAIVEAALSAPHSLSGQFISWDAIKY